MKPNTSSTGGRTVIGLAGWVGGTRVCGRDAAEQACYAIDRTAGRGKIWRHVGMDFDPETSEPGQQSVV